MPNILPGVSGFIRPDVWGPPAFPSEKMLQMYFRKLYTYPRLNRQYIVKQIYIGVLKKGYRLV